MMIRQGSRVFISIFLGLTMILGCGDDPKDKESTVSDAGTDTTVVTPTATDTVTVATNTDTSVLTPTDTGQAAIATDSAIIETPSDTYVPEYRGLTPIPESGLLVIDDFEGYLDNEELTLAYTIVEEGNDIALTLDSANKFEGSYGMLIDFTLGEGENDAGDVADGGLMGPDYAGAISNIDQDWEGATALRFWCDADVASRVIVIQFQEYDGDYWELEYPVESTEPYMAEISLDRFAAPPWYTGGDAEIDPINIIQFNVYLRGEPGEGQVYMDYVHVINANYSGDTGADAGVDTATEMDAGMLNDGGDV